jgi:hypothetical protein
MLEFLRGEMRNAGVENCAAITIINYFRSEDN